MANPFNLLFVHSSNLSPDLLLRSFPHSTCPEPRSIHCPPASELILHQGFLSNLNLSYYATSNSPSLHFLWRSISIHTLGSCLGLIFFLDLTRKSIDSDLHIFQQFLLPLFPPEQIMLVTYNPDPLVPLELQHQSVYQSINKLHLPLIPFFIDLHNPQTISNCLFAFTQRLHHL